MSTLHVIAVATAVSVAILALSTHHAEQFQRFDDGMESRAGLHWLREHRMTRIATLPGEKFVHPVIAALTALAIWQLRGGAPRRYLLPLAAASLGGIIAHHVIKFFYRRPRPAIALGKNKTEPAFPSGHTTNATAVVATSMYLLVREGLLPLPVAIVVLLAVVAMTGASRVLLGWHWATDVLGGWLTGSCVAAMTCAWYEVLLRG